jgi:3-deoxy-D-manno-octulosonate 8-phosphate phosphatase (KDO 8-P phosphatase)
MSDNYKQLLEKIKVFIFDVDGVLTDGSVLLLPGGEQARTMNTRDGYAMRLALKKGYKVAIISGGNSESVRDRMKYLGIYDVYLGCSDKLEALNDLLFSYSLNKDEILYMGDDMPDWEIMQQIGLPVCPADAAPEIKKISKYISPVNGGDGCVREIIEQCLKIQGNWVEDSKVQAN